MHSGNNIVITSTVARKKFSYITGYGENYTLYSLFLVSAGIYRNSKILRQINRVANFLNPDFFICLCTGKPIPTLVLFRSNIELHGPYG